MLILVAALTWALIGGTAALWLCLLDAKFTTRDALLVGAACGPVVWLFVLTVFVWDQFDQLKRRR